MSGRRGLLFSALGVIGGFFLGHLGRWSNHSFTVSQPDQLTDIGQYYHQWSKTETAQILSAIQNWGEQPPRYKTYPQAKQFELPKPETTSTLDLVTAIETRRSQRNYADTPLALTDLSQLLHLAQGITQSSPELRTVPSAGALYPLELYAVVHQVEGLPPGIYHHGIQGHRLEQLKTGDLRVELFKIGLGQEFLGKANVVFIISALFQRTTWKYHERTYRYILMEAGHLGQNLYLSATALGLGACAVGAFFDNALNQLLELDGQQEAALYIITVGGIS